MKKNFIITIDTESDNQWNSEHEQSTENARFVPRFQELCEKYAFKPVYLIDYSMANSGFLVEYLSDCLKRNTCEIGMHLHAWDTPPSHPFDKCNYARPYLIEYPESVIDEKIKVMDDLLASKFAVKPVSHRAGRWAMNEYYIDTLEKNGYLVDCSFTPGINWAKAGGYKSGGSDYSSETLAAKLIGTQKKILEVPMSIKRMHRFHSPVKAIDYLKQPAKYIIGSHYWLRPALSSVEDMLYITDNNDNDFAEFMMHSSELMPGGSPYFKSEEDIETLYYNLENMFNEIHKIYIGVTLKEYRSKFLDKKITITE